MSHPIMQWSRVCKRYVYSYNVTTSTTFLFRPFSWAEPRMPKGQLSRVRNLARELVDAIHFPACFSGTLAASKTFTLTAAS